MNEARSDTALMLANEFTAYVKAHPDLRFWQALDAWAGQRIYLEGENKRKLGEKAIRLMLLKRILEDPFYREGR